MQEEEEEEEEYTDLHLNLINPQTSSSRSLPHTTNRIVSSDNAIKTTLEETTEEPSEGVRGKLRLAQSVCERRDRAVLRARCSVWSVEQRDWPSLTVSTLSVRSPAVTESW